MISLLELNFSNQIILVDHSKAGRGYFDVDVNLGDKPLRTLLESQQVDKMSVISFTPVSTGTHSLNIQFNGRPVIGDCQICLSS